MFVITIGLLLIFIVSWYQLKYGYRNSLLAKIPAPQKWPLLHHIPLFIGKSPLQLFNWFEETKEKLGRVYIITFEPFDDGSIIVACPKVAEALLTSSNHLQKSVDYEMMKSWLGDGLLVSVGKKWRQRRKILTPAFHFQILDKFMEVMDSHGNVLIEKIKNIKGKEVDVFSLVNLFALDVICESAMGCKLNAQNEEDSTYVKAVKEITILIFQRANDPIRRFDFIYQFTEMSRKEKKLLEVLHGFTDKVIAMRKEELSKRSLDLSDVNELNDFGEKKKMALLDILLQGKIDGVALTDSEVREEVDTFMFGGHDTTTSGISFILYNIAKYPEVQFEVYKEIQSNFGNDRNQKISFQDLNKLNYLELVIKESLRIFPPIPYIGRILSEDFTAGDHTFPKNANIIISPYLMGRDADIFPDPLKFDPSRFETETTTEKVNPFAYIPFSAGQRNCIGQRFAMMEMKSIVLKIVHNFELSISAENEKLELFSEMVLRSANGVVLNFNQRS